MKRKYVIFIIVAFLVIGGYFGYKSYYYFKFIPDALDIRDKYIDTLKIDETITVKTETLSSDDYFKVSDINIRNDFKDFELSEKFLNDENGSGYILKENGVDKEPNVTIFLGINMLNAIETLSESNEAINEWAKEMIKEKNIENDYDLLLYTIDNKNETPNIFSSKLEMDFFAYQYMVLSMYYAISKITLIDGDLSGFILDLKDLDIKEIYLFNGTTKYTISLGNKKYFTDDYIKELLNTIVIDDRYKYTNKVENKNETSVMDVSSQKTCEYVRTYRFVDYYDYKGNPDEFYIILDKYQSWHPFIEKLNISKFEKNFIKDQNYEITYKTTIDYSRGFLDEDTQIIKIEPTDKLGMAQTQDPCILK